MINARETVRNYIVDKNIYIADENYKNKLITRDELNSYITSNGLFLPISGGTLTGELIIDSTKGLSVTNPKNVYAKLLIDSSTFTKVANYNTTNEVASIIIGSNALQYLVSGTAKWKIGSDNKITYNGSNIYTFPIASGTIAFLNTNSLTNGTNSYSINGGNTIIPTVSSAGILSDGTHTIDLTKTTAISAATTTNLGGVILNNAAQLDSNNKLVDKYKMTVSGNDTDGYTLTITENY